ncbi:hypothetical protein F5146DRAFT_997582 [Armillaria mellea]|nr:hypothetical protein F5146DRAFT_997582 [Armillaria mellea]
MLAPALLFCTTTGPNSLPSNLGYLPLMLINSLQHNDNNIQVTTTTMDNSNNGDDDNDNSNNNIDIDITDNNTNDKDDDSSSGWMKGMAERQQQWCVKLHVESVSGLIDGEAQGRSYEGISAQIAGPTTSLAQKQQEQHLNATITSCNMETTPHA